MRKLYYSQADVQRIKELWAFDTGKLFFINCLVFLKKLLSDGAGGQLL